MSRLSKSNSRSFGKKIAESPYVLKFFILFALLFGGLMIKSVPPLFAPDEIGHYVKAESFSKMMIRPQAKAADTGKKGKKTWGEYGFKVSNEIDRMNAYANNTGGKKAKYPYQVKETGKGDDVFIGTGGITNYSFINYIPQIIGIRLGKTMQKPIIWQYYTARIFNLVFYVCIVAFAIKLFPFSKWGLAILALNPMALFLTSSVSGDGMIIAGGFFFTAWMLSLLSEKELANRKVLISGILLALLVLMKPTMIVLGMLFFLIPNRSFGVKKKIVWGAGVLIVCLLLYFLWNKLMIDQQILYRDFADPAKQVALFLKKPAIFFDNFRENYLFGVKGDGILHSFVGNFGWLDTPLGWHWVLLYFVTLTLGCLVVEEGSQSLLLFQRILMIVSIILYILLTFFALYQIWNKVGHSDSIEGLQGRYFIPGSLLVVPLFSANGKILNISKKKMNILLSIFMLVVLTVTMVTLNTRYT